MPSRFPWASLPDEELLELRLKDLKVTVEGTWLELCLRALQGELEQRGLRVRPHAWISNEWFSPDTTPGIAIPFYLAHPRLMRLERKMIIDVEGGTVPECMRILRHEAGHVIQHSYRLNRRRRWQDLFGRSSTRYPDFYRPNPASKNYVQHLRLWYAQSHPDEDFAETFAVWLKSRSDWRKKYVGWPALKKLEYVDELMAEVGWRKPVITSRRVIEPLRKINKTLAEHYASRRRKYTVKFPNTYDADLRRLFSEERRHSHNEAAASFLRRNKGEIRRLVSRWTGEYQYTLEVVLNDMIGRCRDLRLRVGSPERELLMNFSVLLTVKTMHFLYSQGRRDWIAL